MNTIFSCLQGYGDLSYSLTKNIKRNYVGLIKKNRKEKVRHSQAITYCGEIITIKPRFKLTRLIWNPYYNGQFSLSLGKESPYKHPVNMSTLFGLLIVRINGV